MGTIPTHHIYCALYFYYYSISSISDHQALDTRRLGTPSVLYQGIRFFKRESTRSFPHFLLSSFIFQWHFPPNTGNILHSLFSGVHSPTPQILDPSKTKSLELRSCDVTLTFTLLPSSLDRKLALFQLLLETIYAWSTMKNLH